ncbi:MAG TPA: sigma-70 family RNA polymerase sigma factor [Marmoricola sp.]
MAEMEPSPTAPLASSWALQRETAWSATSNEEWLSRLGAFPGPVRDEAVGRLHDLMVRAAWHQVGRMPEAMRLGPARREEAVLSAADEATVSVLARLDAFEGRSRFTTWAYKFAILHAGVEVRRAGWSHREVDLHDVVDRTSAAASPDEYAETRDLATAVQRGIEEALTPHQRRVAVALLVDEVPIDVLAERLATTRNALYKTLHEARKRLRAFLGDAGYLTGLKEVDR